jgi:hypothetical protein
MPFKYFKQNANLNRGTMETEDHFKNGVNQQNLSSINKILIKRII